MFRGPHGEELKAASRRGVLSPLTASERKGSQSSSSLERNSADNMDVFGRDSSRKPPERGTASPLPSEPVRPRAGKSVTLGTDF